MQHMRNQNQYTGGKPPYGYDLVDGELIENENEQQVIKLVAKYKAAGLSYRKIAAVIDEAGHKSRTGKQLSAMSVSRMAA